MVCRRWVNIVKYPWKYMTLLLIYFCMYVFPPKDIVLYGETLTLPYFHTVYIICWNHSKIHFFPVITRMKYYSFFSKLWFYSFSKRNVTLFQIIVTHTLHKYCITISNRNALLAISNVIWPFYSTSFSECTTLTEWNFKRFAAVWKENRTIKSAHTFLCSKMESCFPIGYGVEMKRNGWKCITKLETSLSRVFFFISFLYWS